VNEQLRLLHLPLPPMSDWQHDDLVPLFLWPRLRPSATVSLSRPLLGGSRRSSNWAVPGLLVDTKYLRSEVLRFNLIVRLAPTQDLSSYNQWRVDFLFRFSLWSGPSPQATVLFLDSI